MDADDSVMGSTSPASRDLSEITVDEDRSQLDDFLASSTETPNKAVEGIFLLCYLAKLAHSAFGSCCCRLFCYLLCLCFEYVYLG